MIFSHCAAGSVAPNGVLNVSVLYDVSQINFQGIYTADVLITTDAQPLAKVGLHCHFAPDSPDFSPLDEGGRGEKIISWNVLHPLS